MDSNNIITINNINTQKEVVDFYSNRIKRNTKCTSKTEIPRTIF